MQSFMFATGIENSYPTIALPDGTTTRVDEMEKTGHYRRWREDFRLVKELGIEFLRYGPPYYKCHVGPGKYDWSFADETFNELKALNIEPIVDLCHFGLPVWLGNFQNPEFPIYFAEYARAFAERFSWLRLYTPINEMFIAANFSARLGWWNERLADDRSYVNALKNFAKANVNAMAAILETRADPMFIQSESTEYFHPANSEAQKMADELNERRFIPLDLNYGFNICGTVYEYLIDNGMTREDISFFRQQEMKPHCVMGNDYYITNEYRVYADGRIEPSGEIFGYYVITRQYYDRYHLPVMHTETNLSDAEKAPDWLWKEWANMLRLKRDGVPIIGFTWYSLTDQVDWDTALREDNGNINPLGLVDLDRKKRPVGEAYSKLIQEWKAILPTESVCLTFR